MTNSFDQAHGATMSGREFMGRETDTAPDGDTSLTADRPDYLPEKFWDADSNSPNVESLARSYAELERRFGDLDARLPDSPDAYELQMAMDGMEIDADVNARLHQAGFTQAQAQLVYDLAAEKLGPLADSMTQGRHDHVMAERYGSPERAGQARAQLQAWAESALPQDAAHVLSQSPEGLAALETLMQGGEPSLIGRGSHPIGPRTQDDLQRMMDDPRYWRDHDPAYVAEIQRGFELLYPDKK